MADEPSDPWASCMRKSNDLDARRVQGDRKDGGDANETTRRGRDKLRCRRIRSGACGSVTWSGNVIPDSEPSACYALD
jgi:hypothetical protein